MEQQKVVEDVNKALPEQQDEIEDLKLGLLDLLNHLGSINTAVVKQQEELEVVKNLKEEKTLVVEKRLDDLDGMLKFIAKTTSPRSMSTSEETPIS